ncbi:SAM hydrolase/SAM-dependent halogenase family protein [Paludibacterium yongneupense]|uniref:SAM hydrolase/SAM-dependent halogenase family protein n=1 Tax=Paludibacterium yongneupense TaxID=400061 RepID=UPI00048A6B1B|nr:S-adenosyl-l-methionine hydroxide adenosyltransferase family protein [Paludibacterium yongneupense]
MKILLAATFLLSTLAQAQAPLVLMTDFGLKDGAVSAMRGVAYSVDPKLTVSDLTHEIPDYDIWVGAYRLYQTADYWPKGTVFVSVVDPGVGTDRLSVVLKTRSGRYFVNPNNGLLTLIAERDGVAELRQIDEKRNRLPGSSESYTFHGRDVYAYTGARLASGKIRFDQVGPLLPASAVVRISYQKPEKVGNVLKGAVPVLDVQYGNVWTNIPKSLFDQLGIKTGEQVSIRIFKSGKQVDETVAPYVNTFGDVPEGQPLVYLNSLLSVSLAINMGSYAAKHKIESGSDWSVEVSRP